MADTKVSAFTAASALGGTETVGGVQGGANAKITIDQIKTYCRHRADVYLGTADSSTMRNCGQSNRVVVTASGVYYQLFLSGDNSDFYWRKSTNYGLTWSVPVLVKATTGIGLAVWFDKETPSDTGTLLHMTYMESATHTVFYRSLDTASDTLGTEITVLAGASFVSGNNTCLSITKSKAGRILIAFDGDGGTETGFYKSDDYPVTAFTVKGVATPLNEVAGTDYYLLFPGNAADTNDIWALFWDRSANELTVKTYDDSLDLWTESAAITGMTDLASTTASPQFAGTIRDSDGHLLWVAWENADTASAKLRCWDWSGSANTEKTNVVSSSTDDQAMCGIGIDTTNSYLYVFYLGKTDGSETAYTSLNVYYKISTDGGATWGSETLLSQSARPVTYLAVSREFASADFAVTTGGAEVVDFASIISALA